MWHRILAPVGAMWKSVLREELVQGVSNNFAGYRASERTSEPLIPFVLDIFRRRYNHVNDVEFFCRAKNHFSLLCVVLKYLLSLFNKLKGIT